MLIGAAAVSDFRPSYTAQYKLKKHFVEANSLELSENPDVLATLAMRLRTENPESVVIGFAAETNRRSKDNDILGLSNSIDELKKTSNNEPLKDQNNSSCSENTNDHAQLNANSEYDSAYLEDLVQEARRKCIKKGCDLVIGNYVGKNSGFGGVETQVVAVAADPKNPSKSFGPASKTEVADFIWDCIRDIRSRRNHG